ncbi:MAG: helix-turn-helix domain-containing protein [Solirubrobacterales bacterium]|nr:helix-turn-helix domain-containing protein [Solirubrobacterales bacterium]
MATTPFSELTREIEEAASDEERRQLDAARVRYELGTRLLEQRLALGLTQAELASASGLSQADVSRIERGQSNPTATTLQALGEPLGLSLDWSRRLAHR